MSARPEARVDLAAMRENEIEEVVAIEKEAYTHPWTRGNFIDALHAGYDCRTLRMDGVLIGYFILMSGAGEAHLLNLTVVQAWRRRGFGAALLRDVLDLARERAAAKLFLEVRPSNRAARALYAGFGFRELAVRAGYYPAHDGREDALVMVTET